MIHWNRRRRSCYRCYPFIDRAQVVLGLWWIIARKATALWWLTGRRWCWCPWIHCQINLYHHLREFIKVTLQDVDGELLQIEFLGEIEDFAGKVLGNFLLRQSLLFLHLRQFFFGRCLVPLFHRARPCWRHQDHAPPSALGHDGG